MKIKYKRIIYGILLVVSILFSTLMKNKEGFYYSILVVIVPMCILFIIRLVISKYRNKDEKSYMFAVLTKKEKFGAVINIMLLVIWVLAEVNCLYRAL